MRKLQKYKIGQKAPKWIGNYLKLRTQYVTVEAKNSNYTNN